MHNKKFILKNAKELIELLNGFSEEENIPLEEIKVYQHSSDEEEIVIESDKKYKLLYKPNDKGQIRETIRESKYITFTIK